MNKFSFSVELVPPRNGVDIKKIVDGVNGIKDKIDFVSVTEGALGSLRGGNIPLALAIQDLGIPVVAHFVTRDKTRFMIENQLWDLWLLGIRRILALRGDPPAGVNEEWRGDYKYAYQLVRQIKDMNKGIYLPVMGKKEPRHGIKTNFIVGVAGHPENFHPEYIKAKVNAGADFIITQMVFSFDEFKGYVDALRKHKIKLPVIAGVRILKTVEQIESTERFFGIKVNDELRRSNWKDYYKELVLKLKGYDCAGVHFFCLNDFESVMEVLEGL